jgi:hypothetical protein
LATHPHKVATPRGSLDEHPLELPDLFQFTVHRSVHTVDLVWVSVQCARSEQFRCLSAGPVDQGRHGTARTPPVTLLAWARIGLSRPRRHPPPPPLAARSGSWSSKPCVPRLHPCPTAGSRVAIRGGGSQGRVRG